MVGNFVAESGVGSAVTKSRAQHFLYPKEYSFAGNSTAEKCFNELYRELRVYRKRFK